ncbi:hypothetical protein ACDX77_18960 [Bacillus velezensis]|uniref:hypothetical protein n=1 Tax=Bacillus velezensis TaxID=492670 RepID=UPI0024160501|nr:hypothetical protein [Bacillus velezensis]WFP05494.1 hypothetical protein JEQ22_19980 [Bacillus velezensis]
MSYERPGFTFAEAVVLSLKIMLAIAIVIGDGFFIRWLYTNDYVIWAYMTGGFSFFVFLIFMFWTPE